MPIARFQMPDGRVARFEMPEGTTPEQAQTMMREHFMQTQQSAQSSQQAPEEGGFLRGVEKLATYPISAIANRNQIKGNILAGMLRGASNIGATLVNPLDSEARAQRKAAIEEQLTKWGAQPESRLYKGGEIASEIAGTAGIGGALAAPIKVASKAIPSMGRVAQAVESGGFNVGAPAANLGGKVANAALRVGGGTVTGAAAGGLAGGQEGAESGAMLSSALPFAAPIAQAAGRGVASLLGNTTGVGSDAIKQAFQAGKAGGTSAKQFAEALRGKSEMTDVLDMAKGNLAAMGQQRAAAYREGMADISADKTILDFNGVNKALKNAYDTVTYKGQIKNARAADALQKINDEIANWKSLNPAEYHTPEGIDALKQSIGGIMESIPYEEKTARKVAGDIYNSLKTEINKQAPTYAGVMKDYSSATEQIGEIERALSLGKKASADTAMRKLQSLMRNNVNTNYGNRQDLARALEQAGGQEIMPSIAGQALSSATPRGLQGLGATGLGGYGVMTMNPAVVPLLAVQSPRLMGEAAYGTGQLARALRNVPQSAAPAVSAAGIYQMNK